MATKKVWLVTGAGSGFGRHITELALENGDSVVATSRRASTLTDYETRYPSERILTYELDVTNAQQIAGAFSAAKEKFGRVDVVFNNAGHTLAGELEATPIEEGRRLFEVDFWAAAQVTLESVKFFREVNQPQGGRLLVNSSMTGLVGTPLVGYYTAAKHALEGFHETLAIELDPAWNIKITILEPGVFRTAAMSKTQTYPPHPAYNNPNHITNIMRQYISNPNAGGDALKASKMIYKVSTLEDPPRRLILGQDVLGAVKGKLAQLQEEIAKYESWSEDLA
ncbi:NAD(P)-binding protein [Panus rudis PR-1116 ss-1]|nr:NAD(P)-binding protein [Panus rudis PR-1116 ss-1]